MTSTNLFKWCLIPHTIPSQWFLMPTYPPSYELLPLSKKTPPMLVSQASLHIYFFHYNNSSITIILNLMLLCLISTLLHQLFLLQVIHLFFVLRHFLLFCCTFNFSYNKFKTQNIAGIKHSHIHLFHYFIYYNIISLQHYYETTLFHNMILCHNTTHYCNISPLQLCYSNTNHLHNIYFCNINHF
jgi:hypothetical protein